MVLLIICLVCSYLFPSKAQYVGQWMEGAMHGQGTYNYADGQRFHGSVQRC